ncbi:DUF6504 family protein [Motilibacter aurantiacus]|uniref:DUF6504 family protein n=1 Tax=Motilibacter aurantiacus TaxID=2714955 RepID=UPI001409E82A|nr:DUF6504 family protein [Motilibacter aurantiacus]NHC45578.1 hypothetical protein [Motilibacter aurantiacus]
MRRYDDPVDVRRRDDAPEQFLWRGKLYVVRDVLAHWVETGAWWRAPSAHLVHGTDEPPVPTGAGGPVSGHPAEAAGSSTLALQEAGEREMWRVEASAGRAAGSGVFDLAFDWAVGGWRLTTALD